MLRHAESIGKILKKAEIAFLLKRCLLAIPTMLGVVAIVFYFTRVVGNPVVVALGDRISEEELAARVHSLGYDRPITVQFWEFLLQVGRGDLGESVRTGESVNSVIATYLPATLELGVMAIMFAFPISLWVGRLAYRNAGSGIDSLIRLAALASYALPVYLVAILFRLTFSTWLNILPANGRASLTAEITLSKGGSTGFYFLDTLISGRPDLIPDLLVHSFLPVLVLGLSLAGTLIRTTRAAYISASKSSVVTYARAMGLSEMTTESNFIIRPSKSKVISVFGMSVAMVLTGVVFTESTFEWRGLGYAVNHYIAARDFDVVQGLALVLSFIVVTAHSLTDWLARLASPKTFRNEQ